MIGYRLTLLSPAAIRLKVRVRLEFRGVQAPLVTTADDQGSCVDIAAQLGHLYTRRYLSIVFTGLMQPIPALLTCGSAAHCL